MAAYELAAAAFAEFAGPTGRLARADAKLALAALLGYRPARAEVDALMRGAQTLSQDEFVRVAALRAPGGGGSPDLHALFQALDVRCRGFLELQDLRALAPPGVASSAVEAAFEEADADGDGRVGYREFATLVA